MKEEKKSHIDYQEILPDKGLNEFVKCFWRFSNETDSTQEFTILPDGYFDLIIHLHNKSLENVSLTGIWTKQVEVSVPQGTTLICVRFKILAAEYILQQKLSEFLNSELDLPKVFWNINNLPLHDFQECVRRLQENMLATKGSGKGIDTRKQLLSTLLYDNNGSLPVSELSEKVCWSSRQINRYFNDTFGLSLKAFGNILRTFASYDQIGKGDISPTENYYDQSHFIRDIKKHTGVNPKDLQRNKNDRFLQLSVLRKK